MSTVQSFLPFSNATVSQYTTWAMGIGSALTTLGWTKVSDPAGVTWANILATQDIPQSTVPLAGTVLSTPLVWAAGTSYTGFAGATSGTGAFSIVTEGGLTWACILNNQVAGNSSAISPLTGATANVNVTATLTITAVANASGGTTVYTVTGGSATSNFYAGMLFVVSGCSQNANNGVFVCTTSSSTSVTLGNSVGINSGTFGTAVSSSSNVTYFASTNQNTWNDNAIAGHTFTVAGFTGGAAVNNGTFVVLASHSITIASSQGAIVVANASGTSTTVSGITLTDSTTPTGYLASAISSITINGSNVLTVTSNNSLVAGQTVTLVGLNQATFLDGQTVTVLASPAPTATQFSATFSHAAYGPTTDTGQVVSGDTLHWIVYNYEIWKSNGSNSSTAPIYLKLVYASFGLNTPGVVFDVGTQNPSTGQIGGNHLGENLLGVNSATGVGNTFECDFSGDADNFAMILWRNAVPISAAIPALLFIDRTRDQSGNALSTFFTVGANSNNFARNFWTVFNSATGGVIGPFSGQWPYPAQFTVSGLAYQGLTPMLPLFPLPGYVANPCLMCIGMMTNDFSDGQLVNAVLYGGSHTFMMSKSTAINHANFGTLTYAGIRWE
jgi:hypothetical protein